MDTPLNKFDWTTVSTSGKSFAITGSWATPPISGGFVPTSINNSGMGVQSPTNPCGEKEISPKETTKRINIPWKIYRFTTVKNRKQSIANGTVIAEAIQRWWSGRNNKAVTVFNDVKITFLNLVMDSIPLEIDNQLIERVCIISVATFETDKIDHIDNNDFVFNGTMKISKVDPDELVSVQISDIEVVAGKYEIKA